jgi:hypothetical protein
MSIERPISQDAAVSVIRVHAEQFLTRLHQHSAIHEIARVLFSDLVEGIANGQQNGRVRAKKELLSLSTISEGALRTVLARFSSRLNTFETQHWTATTGNVCSKASLQRAPTGGVFLQASIADVATNELAERSLGRRVFLCHASDDKPKVRELYAFLLAAGIDVWFDEERLLPGHDWELEIRQALRSSDVVIACLSNRAVTKRGFVQKELRMALDVADEQPEGRIFFIPVLLEECQVPERLARWQWFPLFRHGFDAKLLRAIESATQRD